MHSDFFIAPAESTRLNANFDICGQRLMQIVPLVLLPLAPAAMQALCNLHAKSGLPSSKCLSLPFGVLCACCCVLRDGP